MTVHTYSSNVIVQQCHLETNTNICDGTQKQISSSGNLQFEFIEVNTKHTVFLIMIREHDMDYDISLH